MGFLRNPLNRFRRPEETSKCVQMLKKRGFNSTQPLKVLPANIWEEPFAENFVFATELKK